MKMGQIRRVAAFVALTACGCNEPPDIVPVTPPGAQIPKVSPDAEAAQAQGETAPPSNKPASREKKAQNIKPALATAKGEIKTTAGGVKYETLKQGTGPELKPGQTAEIHYEGKLADGKIFDSSRSNIPSEPFVVTIGTGAVIKGWDEAIPGMKVGEVRKLTIPPQMAYGAKGAPPKIPPMSTLIFEVELVRIK